MQFKHVLYWGAVCCAIGQVLLALYARFYEGIAVQIQAGEAAPAHCEQAVFNALNYALPVGVGCLALLIYTWKYNTVGGVALLVALALQAAALDLNIRAVEHIYGAEARLDSLAWWFPSQQTMDRFVGG